MLLPRRWQFVATPLAEHCLRGGRHLPTPLAVAETNCRVRQEFLEQQLFLQNSYFLIKRTLKVNEGAILDI